MHDPQGCAENEYEDGNSHRLNPRRNPCRGNWRTRHPAQQKQEAGRSYQHDYPGGMKSGISAHDGQHEANNGNNAANHQVPGQASHPNGTQSPYREASHGSSKLTDHQKRRTPASCRERTRSRNPRSFGIRVPTLAQHPHRHFAAAVGRNLAARGRPSIKGELPHHRHPLFHSGAGHVVRGFFPQAELAHGPGRAGAAALVGRALSRGARGACPSLERAVSHRLRPLLRRHQRDV